MLGVVISASLTRFGDRLSQAQLHGVLAAATGLVTVCLVAATTPAGTVVTAVSFLWVATFSAVFHPRRALVRHLALIGVGLGLGLWRSDAIAVGQTWLFLMATFCGIALVLQSQVGALRRDATTNALTGVLSRRAFRLAAEIEMSRAARTGQPLSLAILDLDDFKGINDEQGHAAGDAVLVGLAGVWQEGLRGQDTVGRFGGDEFTVLLPGASGGEAADVLARLGGRELCGWSAGIAEWHGESFEDWFGAADDDLYAEKLG